jgi:ubiquinone/menaquinone biosynthesis C-methylase UbiE
LSRDLVNYRAMGFPTCPRAGQVGKPIQAERLSGCVHARGFRLPTSNVKGTFVTASAALEEFKLNDAASYDHVTAAFDRLSTRVSTPLVARLVSLAELKSSQHVLDVGTGTGLVAFLAVEKVLPTGKVLGVDLSEGMLAAAQAKATRARRGNEVAFRRMDAEVLDLNDATYDAVLSLFALFHFPHPLIALQEMFRVLRPKGRLVLAVGCGAPWLSWVGLYHRFGRLADAGRQLRGKRLTAPGFLNGLVEKYFPDARAAEIPPWVQAHRDKTQQVARLVREAGFAKLRTHWMGHEVILDTPEEFWELQLTFSSVARKRLAQAPATQVEALRQEFLEICAAVQSRGGQLAYPTGAFYVVGERPAV